MAEFACFLPHKHHRDRRPLLRPAFQPHLPAVAITDALDQRQADAGAAAGHVAKVAQEGLVDGFAGHAAAGVGDDEAAAVLMDGDAAGVGVGKGVAHQVADEDVDQSAIGGDDEGGVGLHVDGDGFAAEQEALLLDLDQIVVMGLLTQG